MKLVRILFILIWFSGITPIYAQLDGIWSTEFMMPGISQGDITAMVADENYLYIINNSWAGEFGGDPGKRQFVRWDGVRYEKLGGNFHCPSCGRGYLETMIMGNDGMLYIAGFFKGAYNSDGSYVPSENLIRWNISTESFESISNGINAFRILALEMIGDTLYAGGRGLDRVTQPDSSTLDVYKVAALNINTLEWSDVGGGVGSIFNTESIVYALESNADDELFVGGSINIYDVKSDSVNINSVAIWDPSIGEWKEAGGGLIYKPWPSADAQSSTVQSLYYDAAGDRMYAGGKFGTNSTMPSEVNRGFAVFDGISWTIIGGIGQRGGHSFDVNTITKDTVNNKLYVGGNFNHQETYYSADTFATVGNGIGIYDPVADKWLGDTLNGGLRGDHLSVNAIQRFQNSIYTGGVFDEAGTGLANNLAAWDGQQWDALGKGIWSDNSIIYDAVKWNDKLIVGGSFSGFDGGPAKGLAIFDPLTREWSDLAGGLSRGYSWVTVYALHLQGDTLYVGGRFTQAGDVTAINLAMLDLSTGQWQGFGSGVTRTPGSSSWVRDIDLYQGNPVITGYFNQVDGTSATNMALYNGSTWQSLGDAGASEIPVVFNDGDSAIYVGGNFSSIDGNTACRAIAKYVDGNWFSVGNGIQGQVMDIDRDPHTGNIIVAGRFQNLYNGDGSRVESAGMGSWNGERWFPFAEFEQGASGKQREIHSIHVMNDSIVYLGGQFTSVNGVDILNLAMYDGCEIWPVGGGIDGAASPASTYHTEINGLVLLANELFIVGGFTHAGNSVSYGIAAFEFDSLPRICEFDPIALPNTLYDCKEDTTILTVPSGFMEYQWNTGSTNDTLMVTTSGTYSLHALTKFGGSMTDSVSVIFEEPLNFSLGNDTSLIGGISLIAPADPYYTYDWSTGDSLGSINVYSSGYYTLDLITRGGCASFDDINVTITALSGYSGGAGDGYNIDKYTNSNSFEIYSGGRGDGYSYVNHLNTNVFNIYSGGRDDGYARRNFVNPAEFSIYPGGSGDGYVNQGFTNAETFSIYEGGSGDGYSLEHLVNQNTFNIYGGGMGDGYSNAEYLNPKVVSEVKEINRLSDLQLYPNPVTGGPLNITFPERVKQGRLKFIDMNGRTTYELNVRDEERITVQLAGRLDPGVYVVRFRETGSEKIHQSKIIVHY